MGEGPSVEPDNAVALTNPLLSMFPYGNSMQAARRSVKTEFRVRDIHPIREVFSGHLRIGAKQVFLPTRAPIMRAGLDNQPPMGLRMRGANYVLTFECQ